MYNRFTKNAKNAIDKLKKKFPEKNLNAISGKELVLSVYEQKKSLGKAMLKLSNNNLAKSSSDKSNFSANDVLSQSFKFAYLSKSSFVGTEHIISGFIFLENKNPFRKKIAATKKKKSDENFGNLPEDIGVNRLSSDFINELNQIVGSFLGNKKHGFSSGGSGINNFCVNVNKTAAKNHPLIGREKEIERISHVLGRKMKNNPVLVGDPGVGKTAIVEGLAQLIESGNAPFYLSSKKIFSLDLGLLVAGATFRGEFESRLKEIIEEAKDNSAIIIFIDEIHNLIGTGNAIGSMDAANILKPALSRGEIQIIGATTFDEYQKHIEKDAALERRFQPIFIKESSEEETQQILAKIIPHYEKYHRVLFDKKIINKIPALAKRYISNRFLPDSAIDLIDETAARVKAKKLDSHLYFQLKKNKEELLQLIDRKERCVIDNLYEEAIEIRKKEQVLLPEIRKIKAQIKKQEKEKPINVEDKDIKETLAFISNVPVEIISDGERNLLEKIDTSLRNELVGQKEVLEKISASISRQISGIAGQNRPIGSFLFAGSSGVGKTFTAKLLAEAISPDSNPSLIQINMSEFSERHSVSKLIGAPAGYVGYEEASGFASKIRRHPHSVVLFDEIEKADETMLNLLLQILEEGVISDSKGKKIDFRNTIIILTSNIGDEEFNEMSQLGFNPVPLKKNKREISQLKERAEKEIKEFLPPELLGRIDQLLIFNPLGEKSIEEIAQKELHKIKERLKDKKEITFSFDEKLIGFITQESLDKKQGARLVKRQLRDFVESALAKAIIEKGKFKKITLSAKDKKIITKTE